MREEEGKDVGQGGEESLKYAQYSVINEHCEYD